MTRFVNYSDILSRIVNISDEALKVSEQMVCSQRQFNDFLFTFSMNQSMALSRLVFEALTT